ncbi:MAG: DUF928 domain-containing protein [Leptolyngbya sp. SIO3F4]|nr:DUF928 domain-containing protein [Leptolyngbya sp. SIO3F4]
MKLFVTWSSLSMLLLWPQLVQANKALPPLPDQHYPPTAPPPNGGGHRGPCPPEDGPMKALAPREYDSGGLTLADQPTLWLYMPFDVTADMDIGIQLKISSLQTKSLTNSGIKWEFAAPVLQQGFVGIPLSSTEFALPLNEPFLWTFKLYCGGVADIGQTNAYRVNAWVTRIDDTNLTQPIPETDSLQILSNAYRDNGLWYDAINVLSELMAIGSASSVVQSAWRQLLVDGGFETTTNEFSVQYMTLPDSSIE